MFIGSSEKGIKTVRIVNGLFWILVILLGVSFAALNSRSVEIHYYFGVVDLYLPLLLLIELAIGVLLGMIAILPEYIRARNSLRKIRIKLRHLEDEVHDLKSSTVQESSSRFI